MKKFEFIDENRIINWFDKISPRGGPQRSAKELGDRVLAGIAALETQRGQAAIEVLRTHQEYQALQIQCATAKIKYEQSQEALRAYDQALANVRGATQIPRFENVIPSPNKFFIDLSVKSDIDTLYPQLIIRKDK